MLLTRPSEAVAVDPAYEVGRGPRKDHFEGLEVLPEGLAAPEHR